MMVDVPNMDEIMKEIAPPETQAAGSEAPPTEGGLKPFITYGEEWKNRENKA